MVGADGSKFYELLARQGREVLVGKESRILFCQIGLSHPKYATTNHFLPHVSCSYMDRRVNRLFEEQGFVCFNAAVET